YPPGYPPGYAPAPGYPPPPGYQLVPVEQLHTGVYVHLHIGGGFTSVSGAGTKVSGSGPSFAVAVGGAVIPNLALFGNLFFTGSTNPDISATGYGSQSTTGDTFVGGFGAGAAYYFMPVNIFISAALGAVEFELDDANGNSVSQSKIGLGFEGLVGKEWLVSPHWGLGAALEFVAASMADKNDTSVTWKAGAFNVLFSATCF
ncbi:MAG TPA: hypothetical protein VHO06_06510, partial [Polyangia bacterium]|nr:hypothetical protein [Polyangia bacterium]